MTFELNTEHSISELKIGATDITTVSRLPNILAAFKQKYPAVEITLQNNSTEQLIEAVLNYQLDGAFITNPVQHPKLKYKPLVKEEVVLISAKDHIPIQQLSDVQHASMLVFSKGCTYRSLAEEWIRDENVYIKKLELSTIESIINFVKAGLGIALVSKHIAEQANRDQMLQFHKVPQKYRKVETGFISLTTEGPENVISTVLDSLLFK